MRRLADGWPLGQQRVPQLMHTLWRQLGPIGWAAMALLALAVIAELAIVMPQQRERAALQTELDALSHRLGSGGPLAATPSSSAIERLRSFYGRFPRADSSPQWLAQIAEAAAANHIALESGEYRLERRPEQRLLQYQVTLPISGSYAQIRGFVAGVLANIPTASLDEIQLGRESTRSPVLTARVRLTLYLAGG